MVHELVRYMKSVNMNGEKIKVKNFHIYLGTSKMLRLLVCDNLSIGTETFMFRSALNKADLTYITHFKGKVRH